MMNNCKCGNVMQEEVECNLNSLEISCIATQLPCYNVLIDMYKSHCCDQFNFLGFYITEIIMLKH